MAISDVIAQIDAEIEKLQQAKVLLSSGSTAAAPAPVVKSKRGRPKGVKTAITVAAKPVAVKAVAKVAAKAVAVKAAAKAVPSATAPVKRIMSPEARKKIAEAQKARWAKAKQ